jgi:DNA replication and repair protein RecF
MRLRRLQLSNYRNFLRLDLTLPSGPIVVVGGNAQGKSNLLEAVYLLSALRSTRAESDGELIQRGASAGEGGPPLGRLVGEVERKDGPLRLEVAIVGRDRGGSAPSSGVHSIPHAHKVVRVNGVGRRLAEAVGALNAVLFTAHDMDLIDGPPSVRRRYLDVTISQVDGGYLRALQRYAKVLQQRNHLLKRVQEGSAQRSELTFWTEELVQEGSHIVRARALTVSALAPLAASAHAALAGGQEELALVYQPQLGGAVDGVGAARLGPEELGAVFGEVVARWSEREIAAGASLLGPHRDDLLFLLDGMSAAAFSSRAQERTIALALRLAEARYLREHRDDSPVLLLDDVLSELDSQRRGAVLDAIADYEQVLVTATDLDRFSREFLVLAALHRVADGAVEPISIADGDERGEDGAEAPSP